MAHVVILGAGIAGVTAAYALKAQLGPHDEVTVVSDQPEFQFVPSTPWVAMGWRARSDIAFPIGPYLASRGIKFIASGVARIQPDVIQVDLENGDVLFYDALLIATGAAGMTDAVPGLAEHTHSVTRVDQAEHALAAYHEFLRHPGPVVIGAAPGASVLGPLYEYAFLVDADLKRRGLRDRVSITLVTPEPWPGHLGLGGEGASRGPVTAALVDTRIGAICNAQTTRVDANRIYITELDLQGNEKQVHALPYAYSVYWAAPGGVAGVRSALELVDARGLVVVDDYLRNPDYPNVFAIGACVAQPPVDATPVPVGAPDSVYAIQKAGETAVHNILAQLRDAPLISHEPERAKWLSDMGNNGAAYLSEPQVPLRDINWMRQGRWVTQAKVDFEKYFINRIRLQAVGIETATASNIACVVSRGGAANDREVAPAPALRTGSQPLELSLSRDPSIELRALSRAIGREPEALASELLAAAVADAKAYLDEAGVEAMARARRELLVEGLPARQPAVDVHGDAP